MKKINDFIIERGPAPIKNIGKNPAIIMIQSIFDELSKNNDCSYNKEKDAWTGKDAELWKATGQFLYDYVQTLEQKDLKAIVDHFSWEKFISDINDIHPSEISMCVSLVLNSNKKQEN